MKEIDSKMKKYGTKEDYYYTHERNVDGKKINFLYSNNDLTITISYDNIIEVWKYSFSKKNIITYTKVINEKIKEEKVIKYKNPTELSKNERKIYEWPSYSCSCIDDAVTMVVRYSRSKRNGCSYFSIHDKDDGSELSTLSVW